MIDEKKLIDRLQAHIYATIGKHNAISKVEPYPPEAARISCRIDGLWEALDLIREAAREIDREEKMRG